MSAPTILIIDDDPDFVMVTKAILETKQYEVQFAYDSNEGFAKLEEETPDAICQEKLRLRWPKCHLY